MPAEEANRRCRISRAIIRPVIGGFVALSLSHCAVKHQPMVFAPYFSSRPEGQFAADGAWEARVLEARTDLSLFEKRRLFELYQAEQRQLKPSAPRYLFLGESIARLKAEVSVLEQESAQISQDVKNLPPEKMPEKPISVMKTSALKKEFSDVLQLWNKDDNLGALARIEELEKGVFSSASDQEKLKFYNIRFRVALETGNTTLAAKSYGQMKELDDCDPDTTQAGFLLSLLSLTAGDPKTARELFDAQCDKDKSIGNKIRRNYWLARFGEALGEDSSALYREMASSTLPGYHTFLAQTRLGGKVILPNPPPGLPTDPSTGTPPPSENLRLYLAGEFSVPSSVHDALESAEKRLKANLRKEASLLLTKASRLLRNAADEDYLPAMLYTAHLFHAAGNHLEAMKLYSDVTNLFMEGDLLRSFVSASMFGEMYPRPFGVHIDWLSRMWSIDPDFVYSIVRQESAFNPAAVSSADARGLMQLMPSLARQISRQWNFQNYYSDKLLFDSEENLKMGIFHLNQLQRLVPHPALIAASYNAGINRVMNWWRRYGQYPLDVFVEFIPINETRFYVKYVLRNFYFYKALRNGGSVDATFIPPTMGTFPQTLADSLH